MAQRRAGLARRRRDVGLSQEALAERLGASRSAVARWERGEGGQPHPRLRAALAKVLGLSTIELDQLFLVDGGRTGRLAGSPTSAVVDLRQAVGSIETGTNDQVLAAKPDSWAQLRSPVRPADLARALKQQLIQVVLDVGDLDKACQLAVVAAGNGVDLVEVGDPLIKRFGMEAVRQVRLAVPEVA